MHGLEMPFHSNSYWTAIRRKHCTKPLTWRHGEEMVPCLCRVYTSGRDKVGVSCLLQHKSISIGLYIEPPIQLLLKRILCS